MLYLGIASHPSFSTTELVNFSQNTIFRGRLTIPTHDSNFGLVCVLSGSIKIKVNGATKTLDGSTFAIVNKGSTVSIPANDKHNELLLLYFRNSKGWQGEDWNITERVYEATDGFKKRITTILSLPQTCSSFVSMQADSIIRSILAEIVSFNDHSINESLKLDVKKKSTRNENYKRLATAREWIEDNFNQSLSLKDLAMLTSMNEQHFLRQFRRVFHKTPHQYLIDRRIDEARKLLRTKDLSVQQVCSTVGWESVATFTHLFKQRTGIAPGEFREQEITQ